MVPRAGLEPARTFLPNRFSYHHSFHYQLICCLWSGLYLNHIFSDLGSPCLVSTPSFSGLARYSHLKGFTEFTKFYIRCFHLSTQIFYKSVMSTNSITTAFNLFHMSKNKTKIQHLKHFVKFFL